MKKLLTFLCAAVLLAGAALTAGCSKENPAKTLYVWSVYPLYAGYEMQLKVEPDHPYANYTKFLVEKFNEKYPDFTVKIVDKGWGDALNEHIIRSIMGGEKPDLVGTEVYNQNYIEQDYFREFGYTAAELNGFIPSTLIGNYGGGTDGRSGKVYASPVMTGMFGFVYNEELMLAANCPKRYNEEKEAFELIVPETWAEVLYCAERVNTYLDGKYTGTTREGYGAYVINNVKGVAAGFRAQAYMRQAGGDFMKDSAVGTQITKDDLNLKTDANLDAFTLMSILGMYTPKNSYALTGSSAETAITDYLKFGKVAMSLEFPSFAKDLSKDEIKFAALPCFTSGDNFTPFEYDENNRDTGARRASTNVLVANNSAGIPASSTKSEQAKYLVECMISDESQEMLFKYDMRLPVTKSALDTIMASTDPKVVDYRERLAPFMDALKATYAAEPVPINGGLPCFKQNFADIWTAYQTFSNNIYNPSQPASVTGLSKGKTGGAYNVDGDKVRTYVNGYFNTFANTVSGKL